MPCEYAEKCQGRDGFEPKCSYDLIKRLNCAEYQEKEQEIRKTKKRDYRKDLSLMTLN